MCVNAGGPVAAISVVLREEVVRPRVIFWGGWGFVCVLWWWCCGTECLVLLAGGAALDAGGGPHPLTRVKRRWCLKAAGTCRNGKRGMYNQYLGVPCLTYILNLSFLSSFSCNKKGLPCGCIPAQSLQLAGLPRLAYSNWPHILILLSLAIYNNDNACLLR